MNIDKIKAVIAKKPRHIIIPAAVLAAIVLLAVAHVAITHRSQNHAAVAAVAQVKPRTAPAPSAKPDVAQIEPAPAASPAKPSPASPASGASVAAAAPVAIAPPAGVTAGLVSEQIQSRDQFGQWLTLSHRVLKLATLNLATPAAATGFTGTRRIVYACWIETAKPTSTVTLHAVGASADVAATIDGTWSLDAEHSNAWVSAPTVTQQVIALAAGWHRVSIEVTTSAASPTDVELQLGSGDTDPLVPVPYSLPAAGAKP